MTSLKQLYELQETDLEILGLEHSLAEVREKLGDSSAITKAKTRLARIDKAMEETSSQRRSLEREGQGLNEKLTAVESKLFSGGVTREKELAALQQEQNFLKEQQSQNEDKLLEVMVALDDGKVMRDKQALELERLESDKVTESSDLQAEEKELVEQIATLSKERADVIKAVPQVDLARYDSIRKSKGGQAVAKVVGGVCQACRVRLPSGEVQRAKSSPSLMLCSSCRRIMYVV